MGAGIFSRRGLFTFSQLGTTSVQARELATGYPHSRGDLKAIPRSFGADASVPLESKVSEQIVNHGLHSQPSPCSDQDCHIQPQHPADRTWEMKGNKWFGEFGRRGEHVSTTGSTTTLASHQGFRQPIEDQVKRRSRSPHRGSGTRGAADGRYERMMRE